MRPNIVGYIARHPHKPVRLIQQFGNVQKYKDQFISGCVTDMPLVELTAEVSKAISTHDVLVKLVKDAAAALEAHLIAGSTSTADETLNKLLGILDDSKTVKFLGAYGVQL